MSLPLKIAIRFLKSGKGQTALIVLGIAIGISVQVFIGSLIQGLQKSLIDKTIGNSSQITITPKDTSNYINDWENIVEKITALNTPINKISATASLPAFVKTEEKTNSILLRGFNIDVGNKIYGYKEKIYEGTYPKNQDEVLIGKSLNEELKLVPGDKIQIITASRIIKEVTVVGFYDLKVSSINKSWIITNLKTVQDIFNLDNKITGIEMQLSSENVFSSDEFAAQIEDTLSDSSLKIENWKVQNEELLSGLNGQSISSIMIQVFVVISVVLGIASVLAISVLQKSKQIGILKAMGIKDIDASKIFLYQRLILGFIGGIFGILFGLGLIFSFTKFALNPDGTPIIPMSIDYKFILLSGLIAVISSTVAASIPAIKSSKLNPMEVIKNG